MLTREQIIEDLNKLMVGELISSTAMIKAVEYIESLQLDAYGNLKPLTMTEAVELSKDKYVETKRVLQQARRGGAESFVKELIKATLNGGGAVVHVRVIQEFLTKFLEENPSA